MAEKASSPAPLPLRLLAASALLAVVALGGLLAWHSLTDLDVWFHLRAGTDLLAGGGFPLVNTYSFATPDHPWLNHEWLFQVVVRLTAASSPDSDPLGWNLLRSGLILALVLLLALGDGGLAAWRDGRGDLLVRRALVLGFGLLLLWPRFNLRPELVSALAFVVLVPLTEAHYRRQAPASVWRDPGLWRLFAVVVLWMQCHGFATIAPLVLGLAALLQPLERRLRGEMSWPVAAIWAPFLLSLVALVLTPNHIHGLAFPVRALGQFRGQGAALTGTVSELVPLLETRNALGLTLTAFKISLVAALLHAVLAGRHLSPWRLVLCGLATLAALANQRSVAFYGLAFILLLGDTRTAWPDPTWRRRLHWDRWSGRISGPATILGAVLALGLAGWWVAALPGNDFYVHEGVGRRFGGGLTPAIYPAAAAAELAGPTAERTFANLDAAAYVLGTTPARVYVDGRTEASPAASWATYRRVRAGGPAALGELDRLDVRAVILALHGGAFDGLAADLLASGGWRLAGAGAGGLLFVTGGADDAAAAGNRLRGAAERTLALAENDPTRRADLALAAAGLLDLAGDDAGARRALGRGLQARADHPTLNHNLGNRLLADGDFAAAYELFRQALASNPRLAGSALNAGVCALQLGRRDEALAAFGRAVRIDPELVGAWVNLAVARHGAGDLAGAVAALDKATALQPGDARLQGRLRQWRAELEAR
ncbi:tetratricopeptide repeat protein [bacterium]|nr:tetratricopeptide repeat protein [bacterium]